VPAAMARRAAASLMAIPDERTASMPHCTSLDRPGAARGAVTCAVCGLAVGAVRLDDPAGGAVFHPACLARRIPQDAFVAVLAALALVLVPPVLVWAG